MTTFELPMPLVPDMTEHATEDLHESPTVAMAVATPTVRQALETACDALEAILRQTRLDGPTAKACATALRIADVARAHDDARGGK